MQKNRKVKGRRLHKITALLIVPKQINLLLTCVLCQLEVDSISTRTEDEVLILKTVRNLKRTTSMELAKHLGKPYIAQDLGSYMKILEEQRLLKKVQENPLTYEVSPLGLVKIGTMPQKARNLFITVSPEKCFHFYVGVGGDNFANLSACDLSDFREKIGKVDVKSLEFHIQRGDFQKWMRDVFGEEELGRDFDSIKRYRLTGESLRNRLLRAIDQRISRLTSQI